MSAHDRSGWAVFGIGDFRLFGSARFLTGLAYQMQAVAIGWFVYDLTHSALALGLVGLAGFLPAVLCALITGHVADAYDRRLVGAAAFALQSLGELRSPRLRAVGRGLGLADLRARHPGRHGPGLRQPGPSGPAADPGARHRNSAPPSRGTPRSGRAPP